MFNTLLIFFKTIFNAFNTACWYETRQTTNLCVYFLNDYFTYQRFIYLKPQKKLQEALSTSVDTTNT